MFTLLLGARLQIQQELAMKKTLLTLLATGVVCTSIASETHWTYQGEHGAKHWGSLSPKFSTCSSGVNQSPINITNTISAQLPELSFNYQASKVEVVNNGHTIQANISGENTFSNDDGLFDLKQFHFHSPSENTIDGQSFPLEAHFVHVDKKGRLAVIGLMFKEGKENLVLTKIWQNMPQKAGDTYILNDTFQSVNLLPNKASSQYYRFNGSLTTPPCTEGVRWFVLKTAVEASKAQIKKFHQLMGTDTNRPTQAINARVILR
jgi:carbonic anhydrase